MNEFSIELAAERIDNPRTREYFKEVLTSFVAGNSRSALVMLWSVVVCDLVYKLQELRDIFNDNAAAEILRAIEDLQAKNPTSPDWEKTLLDEVRKRTKLLDVAEHQAMVHLQSRRHLSAHPILGSADILYRPTAEETRAAIRQALEATLLKPAVVGKGIVDEFVTDLARKRDLFPDEESLSRYLSARYFGRLQREVEKYLFRSLWKFTFQLVNLDTTVNRSINYRALLLLFKRNPSRFTDAILEDQSFYSKVSDGDPLRFLIAFLRYNPRVYEALSDAARVPLATAAKRDVSLYATAWFLSDSPALHVAAVRERIEAEPVTISPEAWNAFVTDSRSADVLQEALACGIAIYVRSRSFNDADERFVHYIGPYLDVIGEQGLRALVRGIEANRQTFDRSKARLDHPRIRDAFVARLGNMDALSSYPSFLRSCI